MKLVVGLGNPGREYVGTRHNIGFEVVDRLARRLGWIARDGEFERLAKAKFDGLMLDGTASLAGGPEKVVLLKPTTYMNLSGRSVQAAMAFYQTPETDLMVVLDDLALPVGKLRIRPSGSSGGHNGLKDIERALGGNRYPRLRVGIDARPMKIPGRSYVLGKIDEQQRAAMEPAVERAAEALMTWMNKGIAPAMNVFNADEKSEKDESPG